MTLSLEVLEDQLPDKVSCERSKPDDQQFNAGERTDERQACASSRAWWERGRREQPRNRTTVARQSLLKLCRVAHRSAFNPLCIVRVDLTAF